MDQIGFRKYWIPAANKVAEKDDPLHSQALLLEGLLGVDTYTAFCIRSANQDYPLTDEMVTLLQALAGPHGKTILKAYRIKKGLEC